MSGPSGGDIRMERIGDRIVRFTIDNPPRNALGTALRKRFMALLDEATTDLAVRCVIITGAGPAFCSGDDLREAATRGQDAADSLKQFGKLLSHVETFRCPVIAQVNGAAVGGGLELALCCDIRVASTSASFIAAGVNVGLMASVVRLPRTIGTARAKRLLMTGLPIDAPTAHAWGLATDLSEPETLAEDTLKLAHRIASRAPLSVEAVKRQTNKVYDQHLLNEHFQARSELEALAQSNDHKEGLAAFAERRDPRFTRS
jgi:enoyl-CoA hydratase